LHGVTAHAIILFILSLCLSVEVSTPSGRLRPEHSKSVTGRHWISLIKDTDKFTLTFTTLVSAVPKSTSVFVISLSCTKVESLRLMLTCPLKDCVGEVAYFRRRTRARIENGVFFILLAFNTSCCKCCSSWPIIRLTLYNTVVTICTTSFMTK
jgi:hypothetical protein